ncbi:MAG: aminotransferase class IV [Deltaproteobacteria bacterium]|nr:aminotransferase class IV [Deltaproteobacteria bacterium]
MKIYLNGQIIDESEAKVSVFDRSFLFGEGLYETFRSYDGKIPFLDRHLRRMEWSATFVGLPFPHPQEIREAVASLLTTNKIDNARIKILLSGINKGAIPSRLSDVTPVNLVIFCEPFKPWPASDYEKGVILSFIHSVKNEAAPTSNLKTRSLASRMLARQEFAERGTFDGVLFNTAGFATETTASNIFWVSDDAIHTPPTEAGLLLGITREVLLEVFKEKQVAFRESLINEEGLKNVAEVFITGSTLEIMPVVRLGDKQVGNGKAGPVTRRVQQLYRERLKQEIQNES